MKKIFLLPLAILISNCSGVAPEAIRDESNLLLKPPFMDQKLKQPMSTAVVEIYSKGACSYCAKAKALLDTKKVKYTKYNVTNNSKLGADAVERSGGRHTLPQIFINGKYIGGYTELAALEDSGELDKLLSE